jgi:hypothetical protein
MTEPDLAQGGPLTGLLILVLSGVALAGQIRLWPAQNATVATTLRNPMQALCIDANECTRRRAESEPLTGTRIRMAAGQDGITDIILWKDF